ncbi:MAG: succinyl-diaminopimelate desuccinylase [Alphaproteobacteria bacterium 41-28]|nr:MAG: succinyl-diaminopimelate desuccinylase [Alphaproteobacteria bacterium 41-28]
MNIDPILLSQKLIRCPSITPKNEGALEILEEYLTSLGFTCERLDFKGIVNLYAHKGSGHPHLSFAGHTDVVPLGDASLWTHDPFQGDIKDDQLWGRGTADMKCAIACFISALSRFLERDTFPGTLSLLITGDEEADAFYGTKHVLPILAQRGDIPDLCLIGEPSSLHKVGDTLKIGRRGSITGELTCYGKQGHIAYPQFTDNPIPRMLNCLKALYDHQFDTGTEVFEATRFEVTSIDAGNLATNIIPSKIEAKFGIRINTLQTEDSIRQAVSSICAKHAGKHDLTLTAHGNAYLTTDQDKISLIQKAVQNVTGHLPDINVTGATTDGRFISAYCPVIECGMREATMHQIDEHVAIEDIELLTKIYHSILTTFFSGK